MPEFAALFRERDAAMLSPEHRKAELLFEARDLIAHRPLGEVQLFRGGGEVQAPRDDVEEPQIVIGPEAHSFAYNFSERKEQFF